MDELGISVVAGTVDTEEQTAELADKLNLNFPVAYGMTTDDAAVIGAKWEPRRDHIQPSEFLLRGDRVAGSTYSNSPVGRMDPDETIELVRIIEAMSKR